MENLTFNWRYSENGIQLFVKSDYIEKLFSKYGTTHIINNKSEYVAVYDILSDIIELKYSDTEFYKNGLPNLSFLRLVGLSNGVYFEIKNQKTNGIITRSMIEQYIYHVKNRIPKTIRMLKN